jgi:hypothetical protein
MHTTTKRQGKPGTIDVNALLAADEEFLRALVRTLSTDVRNWTLSAIENWTPG